MNQRAAEEKKFGFNLRTKSLMVCTQGEMGSNHHKSADHFLMVSAFHVAACSCVFDEHPREASEAAARRFCQGRQKKPQNNYTKSDSKGAFTQMAAAGEEAAASTTPTIGLCCEEGGGRYTMDVCLSS